MAELRERLILDPPNPLATQVEFGADLLARPDPLVIEAEAEPQDPPFAPREGSGGVLGATATPRSTAPSTDALADPNSNGLGASLPLLVFFGSTSACS